MADSAARSVVVGGSIAGMMAAVALRNAGHEVTVLERIAESAFQDRGSGLGVRREVLDFLDAYKQPDVQLKSVLGSNCITVLNRNGSVSGQIASKIQLRTSSWSFVMMALKDTFHGSRKGQGQIIYGAEVKNILQAKESDNVEIIYQIGNEQRTISNVNFIIGADGANSTVRTLMMGPISAAYAGYVCQRSHSFGKHVQDRLWGFYDEGGISQVSDGVSLTSYRLPTKDSSGKHDVLLAYYYPVSQDDVKDYFLGADGHQYNQSLPPGKIRSEVLHTIKQTSTDRLCPEFQQLLDNVTPELVMIQAVTDLYVDQNHFMNGKVLLLGEAQSVLRPHGFRAVASAAFQALRLADLVDNKIDLEEWARDCLGYTATLRDEAKELGAMLLGDEQVQGAKAWSTQVEIMSKTDEACQPFRNKLGQSSA